MQKLAGLITESQYKRLIEDQDIVDRILDKISASGMDSLTPEEKTYLDTGGKSDAPISEIIVFVGEPYAELYKIENFPSIPNAKNVDFKCNDLKDFSACKSYPEMVEMLKRENFKLILDKIHKDEASRQSGDEPLYFHGISFSGDFSKPMNTVYAQVSGDGMLYVVDSLYQFDNEYGDYHNESGWGIKSWKEL